MSHSAPRQTPQRTGFLSSEGTERTGFVLFCAIALSALLLTTVLGTDPAPNPTKESVESLEQGLLTSTVPQQEQPENTLGGYSLGNQ